MPKKEDPPAIQYTTGASGHRVLTPLLARQSIPALAQLLSAMLHRPVRVVISSHSSFEEG